MKSGDTSYNLGAHANENTDRDATAKAVVQAAASVKSGTLVPENHTAIAGLLDNILIRSAINTH